MRTLTRYLMWQTFTGVLGAAMVVVAVILLIDFVETSRDVGTRVEASAIDILGLSALKTPLLVQDTLPFIVLFGVLWTFFRLNRRSELIVMRASGLSAWRIMTPPVVLALLVGALGATALNPLGAAANARFESARASILADGGAPAAGGEAVWLREATPDGWVVITADAIEADAGALTSPVFRFYVISGAGGPELDRQISASRAALIPGFWRLEDARELRAGEAVAALGEVGVPTAIGRQALFERVRSPAGVSFWRLPDVIVSAGQAGLSTRAYELRWQGLLAQPLMMAAAALLGVVATLRLVRLGGAAAFAFAGGLGGFILYFLQELMTGLGAAGTLDPVTAVWTAPAVFVLGGLLYIATTEDG
jgi:lipopolysaccharide export system permease protein